jgi:hypothetical protein
MITIYGRISLDSTPSAGSFLWIDYGMTRDIDPKKHGANPNTRALKQLLHGGMQGLVTRKIWKGEHALITAAIAASPLP